MGSSATLARPDKGQNTNQQRHSKYKREVFIVSTLLHFVVLEMQLMYMRVQLVQFHYALTTMTPYAGLTPSIQREKL